MPVLQLALALAALVTHPQGTETRFENWPDGRLKARYEVRVEPDGREVRHGEWTSWYPDGTVEAEGRYARGLRQGKWVFRWESGERREVGSFEAGEREGRWFEYDPAGKRTGRGSYARGRRDGEWTYWGSDGEVDAERSGTFRWHRVPLAGTPLTWEGEAREGLKDGVWTLRRADGSALFVGRFGPRGGEGPWVLVHADGTIDREWLSGEYAAGRRVAALEALPEDLELPPQELAPDPRRAPPLEADASASAALEAWLTAPQGAREAPYRAVAALGHAAARAAVARLSRLDLAAPPDVELGRRLNDELLRELLGTAHPWLPPRAPEARRVNALSALRWRAALEAIDPGSEDWQRLLDARWRWAPYDLEWTALALPDLAASLAEPRADAPPARAAPDLASHPRYGARFAPRTDLDRVGGSGTDKAVASALDWLARTQSERGAWETGTTRDLEATAFALLAFLGYGELPTRGERAEAVARGLEWIARGARPENGQLRSPLSSDPRAHALALQVIAEAATLTRLPALLATARRGRDLLLSTQLADGSWPRDWNKREGETLTTIYAWFALETLRASPVGVAPEPQARALAWLDGHTGADGATTGDDGDRVPAATAWTALARLFAGEDPELGPHLPKQIDWMIANPTAIVLGDPRLDSEYACLGAHVFFQVGGEPWKTWNSTVKTQLLQVQERDGADAGRWIPADVGPPDYTSVTALRALTFEAYYRFGPLAR